MNDGLREAVQRGVDAYYAAFIPVDRIGDYIAREVRAWLALPPSEEEIAAGCVVHSNYGEFAMTPEDVEEVKNILVASRAVLVRPPEGDAIERAKTEAGVEGDAPVSLSVVRRPSERP